jgi:hypothetical protein
MSGNREDSVGRDLFSCQSCRTTFNSELWTLKPPLYSMKPSLRNLFMKKLTRDRVVTDHLSQCFLADLGNNRLRFSFFTKVGQEQEKPRQAFFARIEQLIDEISSIRMLRVKRYEMKCVEKTGCWWSTAIIADFSTRMTEHSRVRVRAGTAIPSGRLRRSRGAAAAAATCRDRRSRCSTRSSCAIGDRGRTPRRPCRRRTLTSARNRAPGRATPR